MPKGWLAVDVRQALLGVNSMADCNAAQTQGSVPWVLRPPGPSRPSRRVPVHGPQVGQQRCPPTTETARWGN